MLLDTRSVDVNVKDKNGRTSLLWAACNRYEDVAKMLLKTGFVESSPEHLSVLTAYEKFALEPYIRASGA
jgi:ankyrin repeat protein